MKLLLFIKIEKYKYICKDKGDIYISFKYLNTVASLSTEHEDPK